MNTTRRVALAGLASLAALAGGFAFTSTTALASIGHRYLSQLTEAPPPAPRSGPFGHPSSLVVDAGDLYVVDLGEPAVIDEFNSTGGLLSQFAGEGTLGSNTRNLAVDHATGEVYASESGSHVIDLFSASGKFVADWNGEDTPGKSFGESHLYVAVDNSTDPSDPDRGDVYVADGEHGVVDVLQPEAGGKEKYIAQLTSSSEAALGGLQGIAVNPTNGDLLVITNGGEAVKVFAPEAEDAYGFLLGMTGPPGGSFGSVEGIAVDAANGDIYATDSIAGVVDEFDSAGNYLGGILGPPGGSFGELAGVAVGANGDVYVADYRDHVVDVFGPNIVIPDVETGGFSGVGPTSATLAGKLNPNGVQTHYSFQYGSSEALGSSTTVTSAGSGGASMAVSAALDGLGEDMTYYYRLVAEAEGEPHYGAIHTVTTLPPAPVTLRATQTTAALSGTVDTQNTSTRYWFEYGPGEAYGQSTPEIGLAGSLAGVAVEQQIDELQPQTTYHYRLVSKNATETVTGPDEMFTTTPLTPPAVATAGAGGVGQTAATISGTVSTNGLQSIYGFEIGTEAGDYGPVTGFGTLGGTTTQVVALYLGELQPATTYHYRVVATNADGTTYGADETFTTAGFPTLITVPTAAPLIATPTIAFPAESKPGGGTLTRAQKLAKALATCRKQAKHKRAKCKTQARRRYGTTAKAPLTRPEANPRRRAGRSSPE